MSCLAGQNSVVIPSLNFHEPLATHAFVAFFRSINLFETSVFRFPEYFGGAHSACIFLAATLGFRAKTRLLAFFIPGVLNVFKALSHMSTRHTSKPSDFFFGKGRHHCDWTPRTPLSLLISSERKWKMWFPENPLFWGCLVDFFLSSSMVLSIL